MNVDELLRHAQVLLDRYDYRGACELARQVLAGLPAGDAASAPEQSARLALAHRLCGLAGTYLGDSVSTQEHFEQALAAYDRQGDQRNVVWCQLHLAALAQRRGDLRLGLHLCSMALAEARAHEWPELEAEGLSTVGNIAWKRGDRPAAIGDLERAIAVFERLERVDDVHRVSGTLGFVLAIEGRMDEGQALMQRSLGYFMLRGDANTQAKLLNNLAYVHFARGELPEARELLLRSSELEELCGDRAISMTAWYNLGLVELHFSWLGSAKKSFVRAREIAAELSDPVVENMALNYLGVISVLEGRPAAALEMFELAERNLAGAPSVEAGLSNYYLALGHLAVGNIDEAQRLWETRKPDKQLRDCRDDFKLLAGALGKLHAGSADSPGQPHSRQRELAGSWQAQLELSLRSPYE